MSETIFDDDMKEIMDIVGPLLEEQKNDFLGERIDIVKQEECISNEDEIILGIDLGTTNSCVSIWRNNRLEVIYDNNNNLTIPSVVSFTNCNKYVGVEARNQSELNPSRTFYEIKRLIGKLFDDKQVQMDSSMWAYKIKEGRNKQILIECEGGKKDAYTPEELSAMILMKLKMMAEEYLKKTVNKVVITVPAYFNDGQREATKNAATIAGLECVRIINESTAAALAYGFIKREVKQSTIMVYDLGGGTLDVSIMKIDIDNNIFQVLSSVGNTHLGGSDLDRIIMDYCVEEFKKKHKIDKIEAIPTLSIQLLKKRCENAKKKLSIRKKEVIAVKDFYNDLDLYVTMTRDMFEKICEPIFTACLDPVDIAIEKCELTKKDIDEIILVGGSTKIPRIKENIARFFGKPPNDSVNPDIVVSAGASIQGYLLSHKDDPYSSKVTLLDIVPMTIGIETTGKIMTPVIHRNSVIPIKKTKRFCSDEDFQTSLDIKIFEGERKKTEDNYLIGSFTLHDIQPAFKELQQILVTISLDFNGIVDVTAVEKNNQDNCQTVRITSNKNRLSQEDIERMIKEAREWEVFDKLESAVRQYRYNIIDLCKTILYNLNEDCKNNVLKQDDKENIIKEINNVLEWIKNDDIKHEEYHSIFTKLQKNYSTLVLKRTKNMDNIKAENEEKTLGVSIFNNDVDETIYEKLLLEDIISERFTETEKQELVKKRENLLNLCNSILEILNDTNVKIETKIRTEIVDSIDDILLWIHVVEKASAKDYEDRFNKLNETVNNLIKEDNEIYTITDVQKEKILLETLCYALYCNIGNGSMKLSKQNESLLLNHVKQVLEWLDTSNSNDVTIYIKKKEEINKLCNAISEET